VWLLWPPLKTRFSGKALPHVELATQPFRESFPQRRTGPDISGFKLPLNLGPFHRLPELQGPSFDGCGRVGKCPSLNGRKPAKCCQSQLHFNFYPDRSFASPL
jgi:hypothetical protein